MSGLLVKYSKKAEKKQLESEAKYAKQKMHFHSTILLCRDEKTQHKSLKKGEFISQHLALLGLTHFRQYD